MASWRGMAVGLGVAAAAVAPVGSALAQKNSGPLLPPPSAGYAAPEATSPGDAATRPALPRPVYPATPALPRPLALVPAPGGQNPEVERLAETLPLDPQTRDLRDRVPTDPREIERRLGLREPSGPVTDFRGRTPSVREIIDALRPR